MESCLFEGSWVQRGPAADGVEWGPKLAVTCGLQALVRRAVDALQRLQQERGAAPPAENGSAEGAGIKAEDGAAAAAGGGADGALLAAVLSEAEAASVRNSEQVRGS